MPTTNPLSHQATQNESSAPTGSDSPPIEDGYSCNNRVGGVLNNVCFKYIDLDETDEDWDRIDLQQTPVKSSCILNAESGQSNGSDINSERRTSTFSTGKPQKRRPAKTICDNNIAKCAQRIRRMSAGESEDFNSTQLQIEDVVRQCGDAIQSEVTSSLHDPYAELETYLEKVKGEINEAFELYNSAKKKEDHKSSHVQSQQYNTTTRFKTVNSNVRNTSDGNCENVLQTHTQKKGTIDRLEDERTAEWADKILKELDTLMTADKESAVYCTYNSIDKQSHGQNKFKPQKHSYIPLQSFNLDNHFNEKKPPIAQTRKVPLRIVEKGTKTTVLKIEEDGEIKEPRTYDMNKKGSTSTIWTSEESILKSNRFVDEDNKSNTSSECEGVHCVLGSEKSRTSRDSSELENDKAESGIGTASPPTELNPNMPKTDKEHLRGINNVDNLPSQFPICHSSPTADDPLEVLSQYDGVNDDHAGDFCDDDYEESALSEKAFGGLFVNTHEKENAEFEDHVTLRNIRTFNSKLSLDWDIERSHQSDTLPPCFRPQSQKSSCRSLPLVRRPAFCSHDKEHRFTKQRAFCLPLAQEPFQNDCELPSPSSASLHSGNMTIQELSTKSSSAPLLLKRDAYKEDFGQQRTNLRCSRSQSDRYLAEIEAIEACKWLRAAGFPQYAQMYEDLQFPIDLSNVAKDHPFLENDPLQSLYRRLVALNKCATMRLDNNRKHVDNVAKDDSDDDGYALSENWTFTQKDRRWSRIGEMGMEIPATIKPANKSDDDSRESSPDGSNEFNLGFSTLPSAHQDDEDHEQMPVRFRRTGSERLKDGAKAFLRRVESIKSRRKKRQNREGLVISGPQAFDLSQISQKMGELKCIDVVTMSTPPSPSHAMSPLLSHRSPTNNNDLTVSSEYADKLSPIRLSPNLFPRSSGKDPHPTPNSSRTSPLHFFSYNPNLVKDLKSGDDTSPYYSDASQDSNSGGIKKKRPSRARRFLQRGSKVEDIGALSDSECHHHAGRKLKCIKDANFNHTETVKASKLSRGGSLNLGKESGRMRNTFKTRSFRSRSSMRKDKCSESDREDDIVIKPTVRRPIMRWHSFQSSNQPEHIFKKCYTARTKMQSDGTLLASMSCGQLQVLRKLALVTLTGYMERYCPSHRSGWNWELPKFIKKIKSPDYKDKKVFGIPLILVLQRSGQTLPKPIQTSIKWLKLNAMDQVGLFRKSGVKSRIQKLRQIIESEETDLASIFDSQQAYDVADMVKQYFRDLPESLLTAKMSETFVAIFQHLPPDVQADAIQCAGLLLPDENREVLQSLLDFLHHVADNSMFNQMTANNLAVCLAPSLFHNTIASARLPSVSPRRRKPTGIPDPRELSETRASHECLTHMIQHSKSMFTISKERVQRCNFGYMEESRPVPLEHLGEDLQVHDWRGYVYECTTATIKEGREKSRGWISSSSIDPSVEVAYKKISDGHLLRLWRCTTEVDAPTAEVLHYIVNERQMWDANLLKSRIVEHLDGQSQIYQYATGGQYITDYCILRSWRSDLPKGACVLVETSVDHPSASLLMGGVRGVVLASRYLIEPNGSGRSKLMHLGRVDFKGRTPEWYNKSYGHICSHYLSRIRNTFKSTADGAESKI